MSKRSCRLQTLRNKLATGAAAVALIAAGLAGIPAIGQESPESILPPGFGDPVQQSTPASRPANPQQPAPSPKPADAATGSTADANDLTGNETAAADEEAVPPDAATLAEYELPSFARRSLAQTGVVGPDQGGLASDAFGNADGRYLEALMQRVNAPIASRWVSIALRQALASRLDTPVGVNGADYAAERAWLLIRMGESVVARAVVQSVDTGNFTPKMYEAAMQAALATGDPAGLCPLVDGALTESGEPAWVLAQAMCAGLSGNPDAAGPLIDAARRRGVARGPDLLLAEKVLGAGASGRRSVTIEWDDVDQLTAWRYGLAMTTSVDIPDRLLATVGPRVAFWRAQSPVLAPASRASIAELAAAQGVFSNLALVDLYGEIADGDDQSGPEAGRASDLRVAYADADINARLAALAGLWNEPRDAKAHYGRLILTARAAARIPVADGGRESDRLIAAMLSAGLDGPAMRWRDAVSTGSDGWAMLALVDRAGTIPLSRGQISGFRGSGDAGELKARLFFAGLAGVGRLSAGDAAALAQTLGVQTGLQNSWTRALDRAVLARQPGTVVLLAAMGMQTTNWHGVSPEALFRIVDAMHRVGLDGQARMVAVEALTRV